MCLTPDDCRNPNDKPLCDECREFAGLAPRLPDATDADWIILWGSPSVTIGNWFYGTPREITEDDKAIHRAIKHHQP